MANFWSLSLNLSAKKGRPCILMAPHDDAHAWQALSRSWSQAGTGDGNCTLTAERTEGPYYIQEGLFREDITESQAGVPLLLRLRITDDDCGPLPNAYVDIWHCNSTGYYSGYTGGLHDHALPLMAQTLSSDLSLPCK